MKYVVCYSGGHSSALVAIEATRRYGKDNIILINHDISPDVEHKDIKRFKRDVADYLDIDITYANMLRWETMTPIKLSVKNKAFQFAPGRALCTMYLKTEPFQGWLYKNLPPKHDESIVILYGFDMGEGERILRRTEAIEHMGYKADFPLANWTRSINTTEEIGIKIPTTYHIWKHANCQACLKAGKQHWYCVFCLRSDLWQEAKDAESKIGHSIIKGIFLEELEPKFKEMRDKKRICPSEKSNPSAFWAYVESFLPEQIHLGAMPCDCTL